MSNYNYIGIDYGMGSSNRDANGVHYGVISQHSIMPECTDDFEMDYGNPTCPQCTNDVIELTLETDSDEEYEQYSKYGCADYICHVCKLTLDSADVFAEEAQGFTYEQDGYKLCDCLDNDVFVLKSPYYTYAQYCSPCVPGAGNLDNPMPAGVKTYCLGEDWFGEDSPCPYPIYRVEDDALVADAPSDVDAANGD